jgi:hypothetical protein
MSLSTSSVHDQQEGRTVLINGRATGVINARQRGSRPTVSPNCASPVNQPVSQLKEAASQANRRLSSRPGTFQISKRDTETIAEC